jgi:hypothetical protein
MILTTGLEMNTDEEIWHALDQVITLEWNFFY